MRGRSPKAVDARPKPESSKCGAGAQKQQMLGRGPKVINARPKPESCRCGAEARKQYMRGRSPKVGPKPDPINAEPNPMQ
ncbi:hypothetical protein CRG98_028535 [Punica granatum]|uniref:Uncharacterized protein n=1 Tax=Punica granatum TaxID=22663 RepID=A0A2I0J4U3_PUNGR|nr:hypothetical protein CRG98_028535 [Punica granatum]